MRMLENSQWRPLPPFLTIGESKIEGLGLLATESILEGTDLGMSHVFDERFENGYIRLPIGGFINHHDMPNCKAVIVHEDVQVGAVKHIRLVTTKAIKAGEELTLKYIINQLDNPNWEFEFEVSQ
jgi:SET domain-containing protein